MLHTFILNVQRPLQLTHQAIIGMSDVEACTAEQVVIGALQSLVYGSDELKLTTAVSDQDHEVIREAMFIAKLHMAPIVQSYTLTKEIPIVDIKLNIVGLMFITVEIDPNVTATNRF